MTDFINSQTLAELWLSDAALTETVGWMAAEAWVRTIPTTAVIVSTEHLEPWSTNTPIRFIVSKSAVEVWTAVIKPLPMQVSSQVI